MIISNGYAYPDQYANQLGAWNPIKSVKKVGKSVGKGVSRSVKTVGRGTVGSVKAVGSGGFTGVKTIGRGTAGTFKVAGKTIKVSAKTVAKAGQATGRTVAKAPSFAGKVGKFGVQAAFLPGRTVLSAATGILKETGRQAGKIVGSVARAPIDVLAATGRGAASAFKGAGSEGGGGGQDFDAPGFATGGGGGSYAGAAGGGGESPELQTDAQGLMVAPGGVGFFADMTTQKKVLLGVGVAGALFLAYRMLKGGRGRSAATKS